MSSFAPSIKINGRTVKPKGYIWVLGFALGGCEWAIKEASKPEFIKMIRADLKRDTVIRLENAINEYENKIKLLRKDIDDFSRPEVN